MEGSLGWGNEVKDSSNPPKLEKDMVEPEGGTKEGGRGGGGGGPVME